jgi:peptidoglycan/xylan/chitin deacetylase (PgdA/CDA1 family)
MSDGGIPALAGRLLAATGGGAVFRAAADRLSLDLDQGRPRLRPRTSPPFQILLYHRVHPRPGPFMLDAVTPDRFESQMRHLARSWRVLPLAELIARSREGAVPARAIAVTFDDGYADNFEHAYPILRRHRIPATVFLVTGCVGTGVAPWHDRVLLAFEATGRRTARIPGEESDRAIGVPRERGVAALDALANLKRMEEPDRLAAIESLRADLGARDRQGEAGLMLDWPQVLAMRAEGISFGSHTVTHPILSRQDPARVWEELSASKRLIEHRLGEEVGLFAYPNGRPEDYTEDVIAMLKRAGYRAAVTTSFGANEAREDPFRLRRGTPWEPDAARFALKLAWYRLRAPARLERAASRGPMDGAA